jgi:hypothetical protein
LGIVNPLPLDVTESSPRGHLCQGLARLRYLLKKPEVPAGGGAFVLLQVIVSEKEGQLERLGKA